MSRRTEETLSLYLPLTDDDVRQISTDLAHAINTKAEREDELASVSKEMKATIQAQNGIINSLARKLDSGKELKSVRCKIVYDWEHGIKLWLDSDGLIRKDAPITIEEAQENAFEQQGKQEQADAEYREAEAEANSQAEEEMPKRPAFREPAEEFETGWIGDVPTGIENSQYQGDDEGPAPEEEPDGGEEVGEE